MDQGALPSKHEGKQAAVGKTGICGYSPPIEDISARWNSIDLMLEMLVQQQHGEASVGNIRVEAPLSEVQSDMMAQVRFVLKSFKDATDGTLDIVIPIRL